MTEAKAPDQWHPLAHEFHEELAQLQDKYLEKLEGLQKDLRTHEEWEHAQTSIISVLFSEGIRACYQSGTTVEQTIDAVRAGYEHEEAHDAVVCLDCERIKRS